MYIGRFAPSPTGPLHFGSLLAAVASYLEARSQQGKWLLRIEDIDKPREVPGAADNIIHTLKRYGFVSDEPIIYQSQRGNAYQQALEQLSAYTYPCTCSRREIHRHANIGPLGVIYPGTCRNQQKRNQSDPADNRQYAIRVRVPDENIGFNDAVQGSHCQNLQAESGDFIIRRADGLFAYQLAVVVDDQWQGVTHIVRGADLLPNTQRQICLQRYLGYTTPQYLHIPLAMNPDGQKLSKHTHAPAIPADSTADIIGHLCRAMRFLGHRPPPADTFARTGEFWQWAIAHWNQQLIPNALEIPLTG
ncbi:MAG: tRNA glutamyl-Q(34) synthetase GluQRS [Thiothrix nivea]|nr:MAG: tRNA glutamyl-Q(34) synthetase GluQRS [Thiothrix nivea]